MRFNNKVKQEDKKAPPKFTVTPVIYYKYLKRMGNLFIALWFFVSKKKEVRFGYWKKFVSISIIYATSSNYEDT